jgi:membrane fusion protein (multidrug efflux system)
MTMLACGESPGSVAQHGPPPPTVEITTVSRAPIRDVLDLVGQLEAEESVVIKSETDGVIDTVEFLEGHEVRKGDLLFRLRDDEQEARLREAEASLVLAEDEHRRVKALAEQRTVSQSELDRATAEFLAAKARLDVAKVELARTQIRAPFDGVLGARQVSPGDRITTDTGLVRIDAIARLKLLFTVPEIAVQAVALDKPVTITVAPWPEEKFPGRVFFVAPTLDPRNRRLLLKAWIPNPERKLRPGLFANVQLEIANYEDALVIPESAVAYDAKGPFAWRVNSDNVAERAALELGVRRGGKVQVLSGLEVGDRIVWAGTHKVIPGGPVQEASSAVAQRAVESEQAKSE